MDRTRTAKSRSHQQTQRQAVVLFAVAVSAEGEGDDYVDALAPFVDAFANQRICSVMDGPLFAVTIDFGDKEALEMVAEKIARWTEEISTVCPWVKRFGIEGNGEGIVWLPMGEHWGNTELFFKSKGEHHKVTKQNKREGEPIAPERLEDIASFVSFALPDNRLEQGLEAIQEAGHALVLASIPHYLKWTGEDVKRECALDREASGLSWKDVSKSVTMRAKTFYIESLQKRAFKT